MNTEFLSETWSEETTWKICAKMGG